MIAALEKFVPLAPLHQPHNLAPIRMLSERRPDLAQVACFDTAFHATNPDLARRFAIPAELHDAGVHHVLCQISYGYMPHQTIVESMRRFGEAVAPKFR